MRRIVSSCAVLVFAVAGGSWCARGASAMAQPQANGPGALERRAKPITPENPVPRRSLSVMPQNPLVSYSPPVIVGLRVTLDERGQVGDVRPLGPARETYNFYISKPMGGEILAFMPVLEGRSPAAATYEAFVESAMDAVRQWRYDPPADGPIAFDVTFGFAAYFRMASPSRLGDPAERCHHRRYRHCLLHKERPTGLKVLFGSEPTSPNRRR